MRAITGSADTRRNCDISRNWGKTQAISPVRDLLGALSCYQCLCDESTERKLISIERGISQHVSTVPSHMTRPRCDPKSDQPIRPDGPSRVWTHPTRTNLPAETRYGNSLIKVTRN